MKVTKTDNKLVIEVDLTPVENAQLSKSGKSKIAFTTGGFQYERGLGISMNIIYSKK